MIGIVVSEADRASAHIGEQLLDREGWTTHHDGSRPAADGGGEFYRRPGFELRKFETIHVELDSPEAAFSEPDDVKLLVFVSRHAGETGELLTAHVTGNFGPAEYGGDPGSFARAAPGAEKAVVAALDRHAPEGYDVGIECTHHGPTEPSVPSLFVELGSSESEWDDPEGARAVANAVFDLDGVPADHCPADDTLRHVVGFGGGHYTPRCTRLVTDSEWAVGHVGSDWQLDAMGDPEANREVIDAAFEASGAELAVVDGENPDLEAVIEDLGYRVVSETWLRTVGSRPLPVVAAVEAALSTVEAGLRFGRVELGPTAAADDWHTVELPAELIGAANGIDTDAVWEIVADHTVAFETVEGGTLPAGRAAVADADDFDDLVGSLADLLDSKYETVERADGEVLARQTSFDPGKAATLGVPEGPAFGKLAAGEPVTVNGKTVEPHVVESEQVERFPVSEPEAAETDR